VYWRRYRVLLGLVNCREDLKQISERLAAAEAPLHALPMPGDTRLLQLGALEIASFWRDRPADVHARRSLLPGPDGGSAPRARS